MMILLFACKRIASYWALCFNPCYNSKGVLQASPPCGQISFAIVKIFLWHFCLKATIENKIKWHKLISAATCWLNERWFMVQPHRHKTLGASAVWADIQSWNLSFAMWGWEWCCERSSRTSEYILIQKFIYEAWCSDCSTNIFSSAKFEIFLFSHWSSVSMSLVYVYSLACKSLDMRKSPTKWREKKIFIYTPNF